MARPHLQRLGMAASLGLLALHPALVSVGGCTPAAGCLSAVDYTAAAASALIQQNQGNPDFVILDVRTPQEFAAEHIEGAINIDVEDASFSDEVAKLDRSKTYLVYCRSGRRSCVAIGIMADLGFTTIYNMLGGINAWKEAGYPVVQ